MEIKSEPFSEIKKSQQQVNSHVDLVNVRKRRRSARFEDDQTDSTTVSGGSGSPANLYDFEDSCGSEKSQVEAKERELLTESSNNEAMNNTDTGRFKVLRKYTKGKFDL